MAVVKKNCLLGIEMAEDAIGKYRKDEIEAEEAAGILKTAAELMLKPDDPIVCDPDIDREEIDYSQVK